MSILKVVLTKLKQTSVSNKNKTIAEVLIDGSFTKADLQAINASTNFPTNNVNQLKLAEGNYSAQEAMMQFVRTIGPFLSDQNLYKITHAFTAIETANNNQEAYRTSTLAKCFAVYELERYSNVVTKDRPIPLTFLSHMHEFVLPLCQKVWPGLIENNVDKFATFNFRNDLMAEEAKEKFKSVGCNAVEFNIENTTTMEQAYSLTNTILTNYPFYPLIQKFDKKDLNIDKLSRKSQKTPEDFPRYLDELEKEYSKQEQAFQLQQLQRSSKKMMAKSEPLKPSNKTSSFFSFDWLRSKKQPSLKPTEEAPKPSESPKSKRATITLGEPITPPQERHSFYQTSNTEEKPTNRKLRYTVSMYPTVTDNNKKTYDQLLFEKGICDKQLESVTAQHNQLADQIIQFQGDKVPEDMIHSLSQLAIQKKNLSKQQIELDKAVKVISPPQERSKVQFK